jgi:hypothetical protein
MLVVTRLLPTARCVRARERTSITLRNFNFSAAECIPVRPSCPHNCACQTDDNYCTEESAAALGASLSFAGLSSSAADTTTFSHTVWLHQPRADRS